MNSLYTGKKLPIAWITLASLSGDPDMNPSTEVKARERGKRQKNM
jgi:hypothetical protein